MHVGSNLSSSIHYNQNQIKKVSIGNTPIYSTDSASDNSNSKKVIYGYHIDSSEYDSDKAVTYLADAIGMTPAKMGDSEFDYGSWKNAFFMPKPCMLKYDGTVDYYLNPNDYSKKLDGTASDVSNIDYPGNAMVEFPLIYYKISGDNSGTADIYISNYKVDDDYKCWANINAKNEITPHFYMGIYTGFKDKNGRLRSLVIPESHYLNFIFFMKNSIEMAELNNIDNNNLWNIDLYCDHIIINLLLTLISKGLDAVSKFGFGNKFFSSTDLTIKLGRLNDKGLFYGDTTQKHKLVIPKKVFGMEWGGESRHINGYYSIVTSQGTTSYCEEKYKLTYGTADGSSIDNYNLTGEGYIKAERLLDEYFCNIGGYKYNNDDSFYPCRKTYGSTDPYKGDFHKSNSGNGIYPLCINTNTIWDWDLDSKTRIGDQQVANECKTYTTLSCKPNL